MNVMEFAKKYNIPIEDYGVVENIIDKKLKEAISHDALDGFTWYLYRGLGILESYPASRRWTIEECVRDLLQNALDEGKVDIKFDEEGLHIIDHGKGMPLSAFDFGGEKAQNPCFRGGFGEGLKISLSTLTLIYGMPVYFIVNNGLAYKTFKYKSRFGGESKLYIAVGMTNRSVKPHGTHVIIPYADKKSIGDLDKIVVNPDVEIFKTYQSPRIKPKFNLKEDKLMVKFDDSIKCRVKYAILSTSDVIYASDLFFTIPSQNDMFGHNRTFYGYNLWLTTMDELEPNRKAFTAGGFDRTLYKMCLLLGEAPANYLLDMIKEGTEEIATDIYTLEPDFVELKLLPIDQCEKTMDKFVKALKALFSPENTSILIYRGNYNLQSILHYKPENSKVLIIDGRYVNWNPNFLLKHYKDFTDYVNERQEKVKNEMLKNSLNNTRAYDFTRTILNIILKAVYGDENKIELVLTKEPVSNVKGLAEQDTTAGKATIIIPYYNSLYGTPDTEELIRLLIHELAHVLTMVSKDFVRWMKNKGYKVSKYFSLEHTSMEYEYALQYISMKIASDVEIMEALRRTIIFGITDYNASPEEIIEPEIIITVPDNIINRFFDIVHDEAYIGLSLSEIQKPIRKAFNMLIAEYGKNAPMVFSVIIGIPRLSILDTTGYMINVPEFKNGNIVGTSKEYNLGILIKYNSPLLPSMELLKGKRQPLPSERKLLENDRELEEIIVESHEKVRKELMEDIRMFYISPLSEPLGVLCMYMPVTNKILIIDIMFGSSKENDVISLKDMLG